jgi:tetratricopeptide (TPR) repeat protein
MASERRLNSPGAFIAKSLPWLIGGAALLVYLLTFNHWFSLSNLALLAPSSGHRFPAEPDQPLTSVVIYLFEWLPASWVPGTLNLLSACAAALALTLLARSVALLPYDQEPDSPIPAKITPVLSAPTAWVPPVLAAAVCGLELSFWEQATAFTGQMLNLLLFAGVVWCLAEFRMSQQRFWLSCCAFLYGAAMANNWVLVGYLPVFVLVILRAKGLGSFLSPRFLMQMSLWGLAGLSLYLLLPVVDAFSSHGQTGLWTSLKAHWRMQISALGLWRVPAFRVLALASLVPLLIISIRWKSHTIQFGDDSRLGVFLTKATGHFVHGLVFALALWMALDPNFGLRHSGWAGPMLSFYYLCALAAGYCGGYFLLFGKELERTSPGAQQSRALPLHTACWDRGALSSWIASVSLCLLALVLAWRNLGQVRLTNGPALHEYARQLYEDLPAGKSVALSEDRLQLALLKTELVSTRGEKDPLLLHTRELASASYQMLMAERFPARWPVAVPTNSAAVIGPLRLQDLVSAFAAREPVVYLHPSSGLFFERFSDQANRLIHRLVPRPGNADVPLDPQVVAANNQLWQQRWLNGLQALARQTQEQGKLAPAWVRPLLRSLHLTAEPNPTASLLGGVYSKSLDYWGVQVQRLGNGSQAGTWFARALELNPNNVAARINLRYNQQCRLGDKSRLNAATVQRELSDIFGKEHDWLQVINDDGPVDEPTFLFRTARLLESGQNPRQATVALTRCAELAPEWPVPRLWLVRCRLDTGDFAAALGLTDSISGSTPPKAAQGWADLLFYRATALRGLGRTNEAAACIEDFISRFRDQDAVVTTAAQLYAQGRKWEPELALLDELLARQPNDPHLLASKGMAEFGLERYDEAAATLSRALALNPSDHQSRLCRAAARVAAGQLEAARGDFQELLKVPEFAPGALLGLGGVAWRYHDTNGAIEFYERYLSNTIPGSAHYSAVAKQLQELRRK